MEARTLTKKKTTINKGKLKKTIKNVLCRPDSVFWPVISEDEANNLESALCKHRVLIPNFKKPHWKEIRNIPKKERPRPLAIKKVDGLIFGISECLSMLQQKECSAIVIEAGVNPQTIVHPLLEACIATNTPVLCMSNLRKTSSEYFGVTTSCLGIKKGLLIELNDVILQIGEKYRPPLRNSEDLRTTDVEECNKKSNINENTNKESNTAIMACPYLHRANKRSRIFVPGEEVIPKVMTKFTGQDFIGISDKPKDKKEYMNMILKRVTNNANRVKSK